MCQNLFAQSALDVESEKMVFNLESQLQTKIKNVLQAVIGRENFHVSVSVMLGDGENLIDKNFDKSPFDYLPLRARDQIGARKKVLFIESYDLRIFSNTVFIASDKKKIQDIVKKELGNRKHNINFSVINGGGFLPRVEQLTTDVVSSGIFIGVFAFLGAAILFVLLFLLSKKIYINFKNSKSVLNHIHGSNVDELIKFIRKNVKKDNSVIEKAIENSPKEVLGIKSLIPYLDSKFDVKKIIPKTMMLRVSSEDETLSESDFSSWLKEFSERVAAQILMSGDKDVSMAEEKVEETKEEPKKEAPAEISAQEAIDNLMQETSAIPEQEKTEKPVSIDDIILLKYNTIEDDQLIITLKDLNDLECLAVAIEQGTDMQKKKIKSIINASIVEKSAAVNIKSLDQEMILNKIIRHANGEIKPDNVFDISESDKKKVVWSPENIIKIPGNYLQYKLETRSVDEIANILGPLSDSNRYYIISHLKKETVEEVMQNLSNRQISKIDSKKLDSFFKEINQDYINGDFDVDKKAVI